ncbi:MAG: DUF1801 domain-containing protein [Actinomycetia bacterium]|jgi:hypothetical protein|nr:DUF1801 domain-containing protein [Actinomycetes bacterium]
MQSSAATPEEYLAELAPERRAVVAAVRDVVRRSLPDGYEEGMGWGMITWSVPLSRYPHTYNGQPLAYVSLAAQQRHYSLYLMGVYADSEAERDFRHRWEATGRRLDMGKSCLRFRRLADLDLDLLGELVASTPVDAFVARYEHSRTRPS